MFRLFIENDFKSKGRKKKRKTKRKIESIKIDIHPGLIYIH